MTPNPSSLDLLLDPERAMLATLDRALEMSRLLLLAEHPRSGPAPDHLIPAAALTAWLLIKRIEELRELIEWHHLALRDERDSVVAQLPF